MSAKRLYPIKFHPIIKEKRWGEERWEISDLEGDDSIVSTGYLTGNSLSEIVETYLGDLVGDEIYNYFHNSFPLLIKFLDIKGQLSIQVHPDDEIAAERYDSYGKNEAWYIMDASPDAVIYMGFNTPVSASEFYERCKNGTVVEVLNKYRVQRGDFFYIGAGTVHAVEGEVFMAEIQQASDITLRLYDWGKENDPVTAREIHLEEAIDIINYDPSQQDTYYLKSNDQERILTDNEYFTIREYKISGKKSVSPSLFESFIIYVCIEGAIVVKSEDSMYHETLTRGETILVPASSPDLELTSTWKESKILEVYIENISAKPDYYQEEEREEELYHGE